MTTNELRIGNLILEKSSPTKEFIGKIAMISNNTVFVKYFETEIPSLGHTNIADIYPIPITEEWLVRFGFVNYKLDNHIDLELGGCRCISFRDGKCFLVYGENAEVSETVPCDAVHQLQNLYFALTGEELQIIEHE